MSIIKNLICMAVSVATVCTAGVSAEVQHIPVRAADTYEGLNINVREFGAKGDGRTDDTEAIRAAVKAAYEKRRIPQHPLGGYFVSFTEVFFPSGHYMISDTIDINSVNIRGEAYAAIEQTDPENDIFFNAHSWRQKISGITFIGGDIHLNLGNPNVDTGHVTVTDCHFYHSGNVAVQMRKGSNSTFFKVKNCVFRDCFQAVIAHCDMTAIKDTWISTSRIVEDKAAIENYGVMHIDNLLGVPRVDRTSEWTDPYGQVRTVSNRRWIDNYGWLRVNNTRFGGEGGGFPAVYNYAPYSIDASYPSSVTIENSYLYNSRHAAVILKEIPNLLIIANCTGLPNAFAIAVDKEIDLDLYFNREDRPRRISINLDNNYGQGFNHPGHGLPEKMLTYLKGEISLSRPPEKGNWIRGQTVRNTDFINGESPYGWICTDGGSPGTWEPLNCKGLFSQE